MGLTMHITSDLHHGHSKRGDRANAALAAHVLANPAGALLLGGDLGRTPDDVDRCLALFDGFPGPKVAVPGNHDIWLEGHHTRDSWVIHEEILPAIFEARGFHPLHLRPLQIGAVALVGSMGWYDYSFRDDLGIELEAYRTKTPPWSRWPIWNDARFARLPMDDEALTDELTRRLGQQLDEVRGASTVVALVHHVVAKALLVHPRERVPVQWRFANAFLGAEQLGEALGADPRVRQVFCGHIHMERHATLPGGAQCRCVGSDYGRKELLLADAHGVLEATTFDGADLPRA